MKLNKVMIRGFRSIDDMTIEVGGYGHKILVGKNESGKSNILKALRLLARDVDFTAKDQKLMYDANKTAYVLFEFDLNANQFADCKENFVNTFYAESGIKLTQQDTVEEFYEKNAKILYRFMVGEGGRWTFYRVENLQISDGWSAVIDDIFLNGKVISKGSYVHESYIKANCPEVEEINVRALLSQWDEINPPVILHNSIKSTLNLRGAHPLHCVYWEYTPSNDLPDTVNITEFSANPNMCMPLQSMFALAGYDKREKIQKAIASAKAMGTNAIASLLNKITQKTKIYIEKNWQDYNEIYSDVNIQLRERGDDTIGIGISDAVNMYDFTHRSHGFRRFISFLLLMTNTKNSLILMDEPETGLHPGSAKDLRDNLIRMGKNNIVVYATHSISMIDTENVGNNLIVYKDGEDTKSKKAREDGASPGEIIYNAIGHSVYNDFKKQNILLEGYTDKKVLKSLMKGDEWEKFGICYTKGVSNIQYLMSLLELGGRQYCVLSDADNAAKEKQSELPSVRWYTYKDLGVNATTIEDFYMEEFFYNIVNAVLTKNSASGISLAESETSQSKGRLYSVRAELHKNKVGDVNGIMEQIKQECAKQATGDKMDKKKIEPMLTAFLGKIKPADGEK